MKKKLLLIPFVRWENSVIKRTTFSWQETNFCFKKENFVSNRVKNQKLV